MTALHTGARYMTYLTFKVTFKVILSVMGASDERITTLRERFIR